MRIDVICLMLLAACGGGSPSTADTGGEVSQTQACSSDFYDRAIGFEAGCYAGNADANSCNLRNDMEAVVAPRSAYAEGYVQGYYDCGTVTLATSCGG